MLALISLYEFHVAKFNTKLFDVSFVELMFFLWLLSVALVPGIFSACLQIPVQNLPSPCSVRNLTLVDTSGRILSNDNFCNGTVYSAQLTDPPSVNFTSFSASNYRNSTFLLAFVNMLSAELLWMVGNITTKNNRLVPNFESSTAITLRSYTRPTYNVTKRAHRIDVYVFEVKGNGASFFVHPQEVFSFNLTKWLSRQLSYGIQICGPVAATQFTAIDSQQQNPPPTGVWIPPQRGQNESPNLYPILHPLNNSRYNSNTLQRPAENGSFYPSHYGQQPGKSSKRNAGTCLNSNVFIVFIVILSTIDSVIN